MGFLTIIYLLTETLDALLLPQLNYLCNLPVLPSDF